METLFFIKLTFCPTLGFWPNILSDDLFFRTPPTHTHTHTPIDPHLPKVALERLSTMTASYPWLMTSSAV